MLLGSKTHNAGDRAKLWRQVGKFEIEWSCTVLFSDKEAADLVLSAIEDGVLQTDPIVF